MNFYQYVNFGLKRMANSAAKRGDLNRVADLLQDHGNRLAKKFDEASDAANKSDHPFIANALLHGEVKRQNDEDMKLIKRLAKKVPQK